ncbi:MAG: riboflavin synthase [Oligoflexia bacterium]|nr:riboflavin synthase [Oligoflexia bacterium]
MFTGIVREIGTLLSISDIPSGKSLKIKSSTVLKMLALGDSVAINGVCQTVTQIDNSNNSFYVESVSTTLSKTTLGSLKIGTSVNLEPALALNERLGGHIVLGHVNGKAKIDRIDGHKKNKIFYLTVPSDLKKYLVAEGSVTVDGISLTISSTIPEEGKILLSIISHTLENTTLQFKKTGDEVNIEVDILAKYIEGIFKSNNNSNNSSNNNSNSDQSTFPYTENWLKDNGF